MPAEMDLASQGGRPPGPPIPHPADPLALDAGAPLALVIEDDESAADIAATMLRMLGYRTRVAADGHAALYALADQPPDLILLDIHLPEMDGVTLLRVARRVTETRHTPVVACSAVYPPSGPIARILKDLGAERYLSKPFNLAGLREAVVAAHPAGPAAKQAASSPPTAPAPAPTPMFRIDEVVARVVSEEGSALAVVQAVSESELTLRFSDDPPKPGASARLEITHRVAINDAMASVSVRVLGAVARRQRDDRGWIVRLEVRAAAPHDGLERLRKHL